MISGWVEHPHAARARAVDVSFCVDLHTVRNAGTFSSQFTEDPAIGQHPVRSNVECIDSPCAAKHVFDVDMHPLGVVYIKDAFVGEKANPLGSTKSRTNRLMVLRSAETR